MNASDRFNRDKLFFEKLQRKNYSHFIVKKYNRNLLWKQNKRKVDNELWEVQTINHRVRQCCLFSTTLFRFT